MEEIYTYIAEQLQALENAMGLRLLPIDNFSAFYVLEYKLSNKVSDDLQKNLPYYTSVIVSPDGRRRSNGSE
jgi:hypothetical protein